VTRSRDEGSPEGRRSLEDYDDDELRAEARRRGLPIGRTLSRTLLLDLLRSEDEEDPEHPSPSAAPLELSEVFATMSMAKVFARQGLDDEASKLYRVLNRRTRGVDHLELPERYGGSWLTVLPRSTSSLFCCWEIEQVLDERVEKLVGDGDGHRTLRIVSSWRSGEGIAHSVYDELEVELVGELLLHGCRPGALHRIALGWLASNGDFVPLCHIDGGVATPDEAPSNHRRQVWRVLEAPSFSRRAFFRAGLIEDLESRSLPPSPWSDGADEVRVAIHHGETCSRYQAMVRRSPSSRSTLG